MWNEAMEKYLKDCVCVGLDGVENQVSNYNKSGFIHAPYDNIRLTLNASLLKGKFPSKNCRLINKEEEIIEKCVQYDKLVFPGIKRASFMRKYFTLIPENMLIAYLSENNQLEGFGYVRFCYEGYK